MQEIMAVDLKPETIVIHFGMHKTGTSSIQESFFQNLKDPRFHYVNFGMANASKSISTAFRINPARYSHYVKSGTSAAQLQKLKAKALQRLDAEIAHSNDRTLILSGENIGQLSETEIGDLRNFLIRKGKSVSAIAYVRKPKEYMESAFQQRVKGGTQELDFDKLYPRYFSRFNKFDAVFGRESVILRIFDPKIFSGNCVIQDFCEQLGVKFLPEDVIRVNDALSLPALSLLYAYRKFGPGFGVGPRVVHENKLLVDRLRTLPGPKLRFHSSVVEPVIKKYRSDIAWMQDRLGGSLDEDLYKDDNSAVRSEEDVLQFTPESLCWLEEQLGWRPAGLRRRGASPQEIAGWVHELRLKLSGGRRRVTKSNAHSNLTVTNVVGSDGLTGEQLTPRQLIISAKQSDGSLGVLANDDARRLLLGVFRHIRGEIEGKEAGIVKVSGLGQFRIKEAEVRKEGNKAPGKRVVFSLERRSDS
jgi:hypothetical protein